MRFSVCAGLILSVLMFGGCGKAKPPVAPVAPEIVALNAASVPASPKDAVWQTAKEHVAKLLIQNIVEPRLLTESTPEVRVRAICSNSEIAFRLEWVDPTTNNLSDAERFCDSCAVQVPAKIDPNVPAPQMGEHGRPVEITYWNADWQAVVDGRGDTIKDIYPNSVVDHYPFEAASLKKGSEEQVAMSRRYAPARSLGNHMAGPRTVPVQDLLAEGPGTLVPAKTTSSKGCGQRTATGWQVVITRALSAGSETQAPSQVAFAVWEGSQEEVGARKMRTGWVPLVIKKAP